MSKPILNDISFETATKAVQSVAAANDIGKTVRPSDAAKMEQPEGREGASAAIVPLQTAKPEKSKTIPRAAAPKATVTTDDLEPSQVKIVFSGSAAAWLAAECKARKCTKIYAVMNALADAGVPIDIGIVPKDGRRER